MRSRLNRALSMFVCPVAMFTATAFTMAAEEPKAESTPVEIEPAEPKMMPPAEAPAPAPKSDEASDLGEALFGGKVNLDIRLRFEYADFNDTGAPGWGHAETGRIRLGYGTKPISGISGYAEFEGVWPISNDTYNDTLNGNVTHALIADPEVEELNQLYGKYAGHGLTFIGGRQRIQLDNDRFIGNVGWRQDEQTYDAVSAKYKGFEDVAVLEDMSFYYAYLWKINRIFAEEMDWDSSSHVVNMSYGGCKYGTLTGFAYLLDFEGDSPANDGDTYGLRFNGGVDLDETFKLGYDMSYAHQTNAGAAGAFDADYYMVEAALIHKPTSTSLGAGYEVLGSDNGAYGFSTPLATLHAFQGWADAFLVTPAAGVQDLYAFVGTKLPFGINGKVVGHMFWEEDGGDFYGYEVDAVASKKITQWMTVLAKVAYFEDDATNPAPPGGDRIRFWLQMEIKY
jgi:hypothetical protein